VLIYDSSVWHRGGANRSKKKRHVFYVTLAAISRGGSSPSGVSNARGSSSPKGPSIPRDSSNPRVPSATSGVSNPRDPSSPSGVSNPRDPNTASARRMPVEEAIPEGGGMDGCCPLGLPYTIQPEDAGCMLLGGAGLRRRTDHPDCVE